MNREPLNKTTGRLRYEREAEIVTKLGKESVASHYFRSSSSRSGCRSEPRVLTHRPVSLSVRDSEDEFSDLKDD
jgi:hypothetical protein